MSNTHAPSAPEPQEPLQALASPPDQSEAVNDTTFIPTVQSHQIPGELLPVHESHAGPWTFLLFARTILMRLLCEHTSTTPTHTTLRFLSWACHVSSKRDTNFQDSVFFWIDI